MNLEGKLFEDLIDRAHTLGLPEQDILNARDYLEYNEHELCFDLIVTQLHEFNIEIDGQFYVLVSELAKELGVDPENYFFLLELIAED